jgi:dTDP-4-amino-4,6-dideoxygalactose transaminase
MEMLLNMGISTRRGIMTAHRESAYKSTLRKENLPISEKASDNSIIIPLFVPMEYSAMLTVTDSILKVVKG